MLVYRLGAPILGASAKDIHTQVNFQANLWSFIFDIDGCLYKGGILGPSGSFKTVDQFCKQYANTIKEFKQLISSFKKLGMKVVICTGRGLDFTKYLISKLFPKNSCDLLVCEGGTVVFDCHAKQYETFISTAIHPQNLIDYLGAQPTIEKIGEELNGLLESGKNITRSFKPPVEQSFSEFIRLFEKRMTTEGVNNKVDYSCSSNTMDIVPRYAGKLPTLEALINLKYSIGVGDNDNDTFLYSSAFRVCPANSTDHTKEVVKKGEIGIISEKPVLEGVVEALTFLRPIS